ncbi:MAG: hypothetical protein ABEJ23_05125 [Haloarculaceae archaeon]
MATTDAESVRKEVRDYLACAEHGDRAVGVCGVCGTPVCTDGASEVTDATLPDYERSGSRRVLLGLVLAVGVPLVFSVLFPRLLGTLTRPLFQKPLYLKGGLVPSSVLIGLALLATVRYRVADQTLDLFVRRSVERTVCSECKRTKNTQRYVRYAVVAIAALLVVYGLYRSVPGLFFQPLTYTGVGVALYVLRDEAVAVVSSLG